MAFACDTDHDRHGIVTRSGGLMNNHTAVAIEYLFTHRPGWSAEAGIGKTLVSSSMIDRVAAGIDRRLVEVPVGFKWFVDGLMDGSPGFGGEESAGASFLDKQGGARSTDKDGLILGLLAAEITAVTGKDPSERYRALTDRFGAPVYQRIDAAANRAQKARLGKLSASQVSAKELAGQPITRILTEAPGNGAAIGGLKVETANGWFAARPSGTEDVYKIYAESFEGEAHGTHPGRGQGAGGLGAGRLRLTAHAGLSLLAVADADRQLCSFDFVGEVAAVALGIGHPVDHPDIRPTQMLGNLVAPELAHGNAHGGAPSFGIGCLECDCAIANPILAVRRTAQALRPGASR